MEEAVIKRRNLLIQVILTVLTCGLYSIYWFHETNKEMTAYLKRQEPVALWTVFFFIPPLFFYSYYKQGELYEQLTGQAINRWLTFLLWIVFAPAVWFVIQTKLNELAEISRSPGATAGAL